MYPSTTTRSGPTASIKTLLIVPPTPPTSPYIKKYDLDNTDNYIHTDTKADIKATDENITAINKNIAAMLATLIDTKGKQYK